MAALFGVPHGSATELWAVLVSDEEGSLSAAAALVESESYRSITPECPAVHLFERELAQQLRLLEPKHAEHVRPLTLRDLDPAVGSQQSRHGSCFRFEQDRGLLPPRPR